MICESVRLFCLPWVFSCWPSKWVLLLVDISYKMWYDWSKSPKSTIWSPKVLSLRRNQYRIRPLHFRVFRCQFCQSSHLPKQFVHHHEQSRLKLSPIQMLAAFLGRMHTHTHNVSSLCQHMLASIFIKTLSNNSFVYKTYDHNRS